MSTDLEAKIDIIAKQVQENTKILKELRSRSRWATIIGFVKWMIYALILIGAYSVLKPILEQVMGTYAAIQGGADSLADIKAGSANFDFSSLKEYFK